MFIIGFISGGFLGFLILAMFVASKPETDTTEAFENGVEYGLRLHAKHGSIIATNQDEILVEYNDDMYFVKRFREVKETI
jgi:hypothetical protein